VLGSRSQVFKTLGEQVYEYLFIQLKQRALAPGSYLDLDQIAARLGVSRTPLRDALFALEVEGYVEIVPRRGVKVKYLTIEEIRHIYQVIGALEATAIRDAARTLAPEDLAHLDAITDRYEQQFLLGGFDENLDVNYQFHDFFLDRCGNPVLTRIVRTQKRRLYDWPRHTELLWEWERRNVNEHRLMVAHLKAGDPAAAGDVMQYAHWGFEPQEHLIRSFYEGPPAPKP
jgi:DNA-binding GntR family transcriptional regulator